MTLPHLLAAAGALYVLGKLWDSLDASERAKYGRKREVKAARYLASKGATVEVSPGSRGAWDIRAEWRDEVWLIQLKSSRSSEPKLPSPRERAALKAEAARVGAVPVVGLCRDSRTLYYDIETEERLFPSRM